MQKPIFLFSMVIAVFACTKETVQAPPAAHPSMIYTNLHDSLIHFGRFASFDLDKNGEKDIAFHTLLVGDAINQQDKRQWLVSTFIKSSLPVDGAENIPVLNLNDTIGIKDFGSYKWYTIATVLLAQKIIGVQPPPYWLGNWKEAAHRFIPFLVKRNNLLYAGWVEISFNKAQENVMLHRAAICTEENKTIQAGK